MTGRRPHTGGALDNPILVGSITVLVVLVAMVLSYNANTGLPFVPSYELHARVPDAAELTKGNEVRIGGKRVGLITKLTAQRADDGHDYADLELKLDKTLAELPDDTAVTVRPRSPLGLRYLELRPGRSKEGIPHGGTLPERNAQAIVELDELVDSLDAPTRADLQAVLVELGNGLAGRGQDLNRFFSVAEPLVESVRAVAANVSDPATRLSAAIAGAASAAAAVAPAASELAGLAEGAAVTADALADERDALAEVLGEAPPTEDAALAALPAITPVLEDAAAIAEDLRPGTRLLPVASHRLALALETGTPVLRRATGLADRLGTALAALRDLARNPATGGSVRKLTAVVASLEPTLRYVVPFQTVCNYLGLWTRNASSAIAEGDANGTWFRFIPVGQPDEVLQRSDPAPALHANPYPHTGANGECEAGNEAWTPGQVIGHTPATEPGRTQVTRPPAGVGAP